MRTNYGFGLYKSVPSEHDFLLRSVVADVVLPPEFDLTDKMTPVRSQGQEGACVGFAMAVGVKEYQETTGLDAKPGIELSPRYLYEAAKVISGHSEGTTLKAAMQVAHKYGVCEERFWPYVAGAVGQPLAGAEKNAARHKVKTYARITNIKELMQAIVDKRIGPILIGVKVYKGMISKGAKKTGVTPDPSCWERLRVLGGHAITPCAYKHKSPYYKNDGHIKCKGSWGKKYGDNGYHYLSYRYIKANMLDAFSCIDIESVETGVGVLGGQLEWTA